MKQFQTLMHYSMVDSFADYLIKNGLIVLSILVFVAFCLDVLSYFLGW